MLLQKTETAKFKEIYEDMTTQFPENELKSYDKFVELLNSGVYEFYVAKDNSEDVGYCLMLMDEITDTMWLDYVAIFKSFHSKGYGSEIIKSFVSAFPNLNGCFLEVEKADESSPNTIRRIDFYKNLGAVKLDCEYFYPHKDGCLAMDLYFLPFKTEFVPSSATVKAAIENAFKTLHNDLPHLKEIFKKIR